MTFPTNEQEAVRIAWKNVERHSAEAERWGGNDAGKVHASLANAWARVLDSASRQARGV